MEENEEEYRAAIKEYYRIYRELQKIYRLKESGHSDLYGNNLIEIWEYKGDGRVRRICKVEAENETECYRRAAEILKNYGRKKAEEERDEKKAG